VGPYRLERELGRGGMGTVWLARRTDGLLKRPVALKLPIAGPRIADLTRRFGRERDILADLAHPNIARLYDAGVTAEGQPYLALEYIDGTPIIAYCDRHRLSIRGRLGLYSQVLHAVRYAHSRLVIHRDLKPSNILVTNEGRVSLLDFGIAKLLDDPAAASMQLTQMGAQLLTPDYASPEQLAGQALSTSSDVYSLGVLLYELLAGGRPYVLKRTSRAALEEAILTTEPKRLSQAEFDAAVAANRAAVPGKLRKLLRGDLDTITAKALKKNPAERYATVDAFSQDIDRYLTDQPILAQADSRWYRARLFVSRYRYAIGSVAAVIVALSAGLAVAFWQSRIARAEANTSHAVQEFLQDIFKANASDQQDPLKARQMTARQLLDVGSAKIDNSLNDAPAARLDVLATLARMYQDIGLIDQAVVLKRKRLRLAQEVYGPNRAETADALIDLGSSLASSSAVAERDQVLAQAERILDALHDDSSPMRARLLQALGDEYYDRDAKKALSYAERALQMMRKRPDSVELKDALFNLAVMCGFNGEPARAESLYTESLAVSYRLHPGGDDLRPQIYTYLADVQGDQQKFAAAEKNYRAATAAARVLGDADSLEAIRADHGLGLFLFKIGKTAEGLSLMASAKERILKVRGPEDSELTPWVMTGYARSRVQMGEIEEGLADLRQVEANQRRYRPGARVLALVLEREAMALGALGRFDEAEGHLKEAGQIHAAIHEQGTDLNDHDLILAHTLRASGKPQAALAMLARIQPRSAAPGTLSEDSLRLWIETAAAQLGVGAPAEASISAAQARKILGQSSASSYFPHDAAELAALEGKIGLASGQTERAIEALQRARSQYERLYDAGRSLELADVDAALAKAYSDLGRRDTAGAYNARSALIWSRHPQMSPRSAIDTATPSPTTM